MHVSRLALTLALALTWSAVDAQYQLRKLSQLVDAEAISPTAFLRDKGRFLRKNVNDLDALLKVVANGPLVTVSIFNKAYREMAVNWYYALTRFGRVRNIVLVAYDTASLVECLDLGFACFNGSSLLATELTSEDVSHGRAEYHALMWGKPIFMNEILKRNYNVFHTDLDTVWIKDALRSLHVALDEHDADFIGMNDQNSGKPNAGNLLIRSNARTRQLMATWLAEGKQGQGDLRTDFHDQQGLWNVQGRAWEACGTAAECEAVKLKGLAALWLHPWHGCPWEHNDYPTSRWRGGICDNELAYLHIFCTAGGVRVKREMATRIGVWFVDEQAPEPIMRGARAHELVDAAEAHNINGSPSLPCANEVAWQGL